MNGAFFGTKKVISNLVNMVSCSRTKHGVLRKMLLTVFMGYMVITFMLQFFIVGAMFAAIYSFWDIIFMTIFEGRWALSELYQSGLFSLIFSYIYLMLLSMSLILSLALPLDKARPCFLLVTIAFGFLSLVSLFGMAYYMAD